MPLQPPFVKDNIIIKELPYVDARGYGTPSGAQDGGAIQTAINSIGSLEKTLLLAPGIWDIGIPIIVPSNVHLRFEKGAKLQIRDVTFRIEGSLEAPLSQIFQPQGTGKVYFGSSTSIENIYPQWWGATGIGDAQHNDYSAIQSALDAATYNAPNNLKFRTVVLVSGKYYVDQTLIIKCDLVGLTNPFQDETAVIEFHGSGACLRNEGSYTQGMIIKNIEIDLLNSDTTQVDTYGIFCYNGQTFGVFEHIKIKCNESTTQHPRNGIYISGNQSSVNCTANRFIDVIIQYPKIGIWIGDNVNQGFGSNNIIMGGEITLAIETAVKLTGGQNVIIGGALSVQPTQQGQPNSTVISFEGSECHFNSIIGTELEIQLPQQGQSQEYFITISSNVGSGIEHVFTATAIRTLGGDYNKFVNDVFTSRQRWVAIRDEATIEARNYIAQLYSQAKVFYPQCVDQLLTGPFDGSVIGQGSGKALEIKAGSEATPGVILFGRENAPTPPLDFTFPGNSFPVTYRGITLMIGPGGRIYFVKSSADGTLGETELGNIDPNGNMIIKGVFHFKNDETIDNGRDWSYSSSIPTTAGSNGQIFWNNNPIPNDISQGYVGWIFANGSWHPFGKIE